VIDILFVLIAVAGFNTMLLLGMVIVAIAMKLKGDKRSLWKILDEI
jgi:hypothetical protein